MGQLVTDGTTATQTRFFMGGAYESTSDTPLATLGGAPLCSVGTTEAVRKYYAIAGQTFAMSDNGVIKYLLTDHLGSTVAITDAAGTMLSETRYMPFCESRADVGLLTGTDKTFTSQRDMPGTGLMDYHARAYSPWLGRFIQPDSIVPGAANPQSWNRYAYVVNNPILFNDPTGHDVGCPGMDASACWLGNASSDLINSTIEGYEGGPRVHGSRHGADLFIPYGEFPDLGDFILRECGDYEVAGNFPNNSCVTQQNGYALYQQTEEIVNSYPYTQPDYQTIGFSMLIFNINYIFDRYQNKYISIGVSYGKPLVAASLTNGFINPITNHILPSENELIEELGGGSLSLSAGFVAGKTMYFDTGKQDIIEEGLFSPSYGFTYTITTFRIKK